MACKTSYTKQGRDITTPRPNKPWVYGETCPNSPKSITSSISGRSLGSFLLNTWNAIMLFFCFQFKYNNNKLITLFR